MRDYRTTQSQLFHIGDQPPPDPLVPPSPDLAPELSEYHLWKLEGHELLETRDGFVLLWFWSRER